MKQLNPENFKNNIEELKKELKRVASIKCRLKKQIGKQSSKQELQNIIQYETSLKSIRDSIISKPKSVPQYTQSDIDSLSYNETIKALKSIQSKKSLSKWLTTIEGDNDQYRNAIKVEQLLLKHKETLQPSINQSYKSTIEHILSNQETLSKEEILQILSESL